VATIDSFEVEEMEIGLIAFVLLPFFVCELLVLLLYVNFFLKIENR
jgi:hypothetical protein